jgi:hypothetical protein
VRLRPLSLVLFGLFASAVAGCETAPPSTSSGRSAAVGEAPGSTLTEAARRTFAAGPSRIEVTVQSADVRYRLAGRLDASRGYRLCSAIGGAPTGYLAGRVLWLEGRRATYGTLTAHGSRCARGAPWLDDHPPTMELFDVRAIPAGGRAGAEDYLHATLLALTSLQRGSATQERGLPCGRSRCYAMPVDFGKFDREPPERDEDAWTLRPLVRALASHRIDVRVGRAGFVDRLRLAVPAHGERMPGPVTVALRLFDFGQAAGVPRVQAKAVE